MGTLVSMVAIGVAGGLGSVLRWWVGRWVGERVHTIFPLGTFLINVTGSFAIAFLAMLIADTISGPYAKFVELAVLTGLLGGYTTFSTMALEATQAAEAKRRSLAFFYLVFSVAAGLLGAWAGVVTGTAVAAIADRMWP